MLIHAFKVSKTVNLFDQQLFPTLGAKAYTRPKIALLLWKIRLVGLRFVLLPLHT